MTPALRQAETVWVRRLGRPLRRRRSSSHHRHEHKTGPIPPHAHTENCTWFERWRLIEGGKALEVNIRR